MSKKTKKNWKMIAGIRFWSATNCRHLDRFLIVLNGFLGGSANKPKQSWWYLLFSSHWVKSTDEISTVLTAAGRRAPQPSVGCVICIKEVNTTAPTDGGGHRQCKLLGAFWRGKVFFRPCAVRRPVPCCDRRGICVSQLYLPTDFCANELIQPSADFPCRPEKITFIACRTNSGHKSGSFTIAASFTAPFVEALEVRWREGLALRPLHLQSIACH